jgi:hypothetical protein
MKTRPILLTILVTISLFLVLCPISVFGAAFFSSRAIDFPSDDRQFALDATKTLLEATEEHPTGPLPTSDPNLPSYLWVNENCWRLLQQAMAANENIYTLDIISYYNSDNDPNRWRDAVEVWVQVDFKNGLDAKVLYSQGGLAGCQEMR